MNTECNFKIGTICKFEHQSDKLIYMGYNYSGNGYWHQFSKLQTPNDVWCEITEQDLYLIKKVLI